MTMWPPQSHIASDPAAHVRTALHPQIYHHSIRTYLLGVAAARGDGAVDLDAESLCLAALFHDAGASARYDGPARFEVEGADAAARYLQGRGWNAAVIDPIWSVTTRPDAGE